MITSATIENFKGFKRLYLPDLSRITLLGGRNNTGKTSVLEAMFLFQDKAQPDFFRDYFDWRGISFPFEPENILEPLFHNYDLEKKFTVEVLRDNHEEALELEINQTQQSLEITPVDERFSHTGVNVASSLSYTLEVTYKSEKKKEQQSRLVIRYGRVEVQGDSSKSKLRNVAFVTARARTTEDVRRFGQLDILGKRASAVDLLKIPEPRLRDLSTIQIGQSALIYGDIGLSRKIPVAHMGEGMNRLLSIILAIATCKDGLVLINEFENGLHHSIIAQVWEAISKAAREFNCQIIATTHSYECLKAANEGTSHAGLSDEFRYVRLDRAPDDIIAKTYTHAMMEAAIERGWEVR